MVQNTAIGLVPTPTLFWVTFGDSDVENLVKNGLVEEKTIDVLKKTLKDGVRKDVIHL